MVGHIGKIVNQQQQRLRKKKSACFGSVSFCGCVREREAASRARVCVCTVIYTPLPIAHESSRRTGEAVKPSPAGKKKRQEEKQNVFDGVEAEKFKIKEKKESRVKSVE